MLSASPPGASTGIHPLCSTRQRSRFGLTATLQRPAAACANLPTYPTVPPARAAEPGRATSWEDGTSRESDRYLTRCSVLYRKECGWCFLPGPTSPVIPFAGYLPVFGGTTRQFQPTAGIEHLPRANRANLPGGVQGTRGRGDGKQKLETGSWEARRGPRLPRSQGVCDLVFRQAGGRRRRVLHCCTRTGGITLHTHPHAPIGVARLHGCWER
jgi:hypothetical protein